jgi:oligogalacturonide lyase
MDTKSGEMRQITDYEVGVQPGAAALLPDDRAAVCMYGANVDVVPLGAGKARTIYTAGQDAKPQALALTSDGSACLVLEQSGSSFVVRQVPLLKKAAEIIVEEKNEIAGLRPRPRTGDLLYRQEGRLRLVAGGNGKARELTTPASVRQALWSADGKSILYITVSEQRGQPVQLREHFPESGDDKLLANTSQYVSFTRNADASVFAGICGNKGAPHVLLLLRVTHRELTVSEHRASVPAAVVIFFSPDSQRIFYHSDRGGRPAIYGVPAEKLVERTET